LTCHVDIQGNEDFVNDGDTSFWLGNTFFVLSISVTEVQYDDTEGGERDELNKHSSQTKTSTNLPSIGVRSEQLTGTYN
jgi:hypothetical protein